MVSWTISGPEAAITSRNQSALDEPAFVAESVPPELFDSDFDSDLESLDLESLY
jgi:hypothetical protein